ncbi:DUF4179 domain-containing protein [Clostridium sp.]|uniref:DUF4179 domain-containing protein n=1 Tax=Clostridium sp. TaxID=1506 RepID=UPI003F2E7BB5
MNKDKFDDIKVPSNIKTYVESGLDKAEKEIKEKNKKKRKRNIGMVAALAIIVISAGISNPTFADDIPILKEIFKVLEKKENPVINSGNYSEYATNIGISKESNGITITIEEAVYTGDEVYVSYKIENKEDFPYLTNISPNGYIVNEQGDYVQSNELIEKDIEKILLDEEVNFNYTQEVNFNSYPFLTGMFVDSKTFIGLRKYELVKNETIINNDGAYEMQSIDIPEDIEISIKIPSVSLPVKNSSPELVESNNNERYVVEGNWEFNIPLKLAQYETEEIEVNEVKDGFKLEKIIKTPFDIKVKVVPLNQENKKTIFNKDNLPANDIRLYEAFLIDKDGLQQAYGLSPSYFGMEEQGDGALYIEMQKDKNKMDESFEIVIQDNTREGESCIKICENNVYHGSLPHPKFIQFDTKIKFD